MGDIRDLTDSSAAWVLAALLIVAFTIVHWMPRKSRRFPPGPPPRPLIGNLKDLMAGLSGSGLRSGRRSMVRTGISSLPFI